MKPLFPWQLFHFANHRFNWLHWRGCQYSPKGTKVRLKSYSLAA